MKYKTFTHILIFSLFFSCGLSAQWESLGDEILEPGHRVWSIKVAPDRSVWAITSFDAFPPTSRTPKVFRSADEGSTWQKSEISSAVSNKAWDIAPIDKNNAFVALNTVGLYQTTNGGQNWTKVNSFNYQPLYVHFFNDLEGWTLSHSGVNTIMSYTEDGGESWVDISYLSDFPDGTSLPPIDATEYVWSTNFSVNSAYDYDDQTLILGTTKGGVWISEDKGRNWERKSSPLEVFGLRTTNIAMKDETTFMVVGDTELETNDSKKTVSFTTTDGGETWIKGNPGVTAAASHYIPNSDSIFITVGHNNFGSGSVGTAISYDYGENWEIIHDTRLIAIDFLDENTGYGSCCNNAWETTDGQIFKWKFDFTTSTFEIVKSDKVKIMPNPVNDYLTILPENEFQSDKLLVEIISASGQLLSTTEVKKNRQIDIQTANLPNGLYSLRITGKRKSVIKKFIKQ